MMSAKIDHGWKPALHRTESYGEVFSNTLQQEIVSFRVVRGAILSADEQAAIERMRVITHLGTPHHLLIGWRS